MNSPSLPGGYTVEPLGEGNLADLDRLHEAVYGRKPAAGYFRKKYDTRFAGVSYVGFLAYAGTVPAAFYGVLPCLVDIDGERVRAAQSADTMTHPEHRQKGLFVQLASLTFDMCRERGIRFLFGFPNQNSAPGFLGKLAWQSPFSLDYFRIPCGTPAWLSRVQRLPVIRRWVGRYRERLLTRHAATEGVVENSVFADGFHGVRHDEAWFRYKAYTRTHVVAVAGCRAWIKLGNFMVIGDMDATAGTFDAAIDGLVDLARRLGMSEIYAYGSPGARLHGLLAGKYVPSPAFPVIFKVLEGDLPIERIRFTFADVDVF